MPAAGDFTCADLEIVHVAMEGIFADSAANKDYIANAEAARALLSEQTATFTALQNPGKDLTVRAEWVEVCDATVANCTDSCVIDGEEASANCKDYTISLCKETTFKVGEETFRTSSLTRQEVVAKLMLKHMKALDEQIAQTVVASLDSFAGVNKFLGGFVAAGGDTDIPAAQFNASIFGYLAQASVVNKYSNPFLLNGSNLYQHAWNAMAEAGNDNGSGNAFRFGSMRQYYDLFNMDSILGDKKTLLIDPNAAALVSQNRWGGEEQRYFNGADQIRYSVPSQNLPGVMYDVIYVTKCASDDITHHWRLIARYDVFQNPVSSCDTDITGILSFKCV